MKKKPSQAKVPPAVNRRAAEQSLKDVIALLEGKEFSSDEEANAFLQDMLAHRGIPHAPAITPLELRYV
ncbi:MAG: hypothetical protein NTV84_10350 [Methanoregula sp.]|nr:hypothetical protein [Methanoregula sp.]